MSINSLDLQFGKKLLGSHGGLSKPEIDIPFLLNLIKSRELDFREFPHHEYSLENINIAIKDLEQGATGRMIINLEI